MVTLHSLNDAKNGDIISLYFYVPEDKLAVQVSYSITQAGSTFDREVDALKKLPKVLPCDRRVILTYDESDTITDEFGIIEVMPLWKWILFQQRDLQSLRNQYRCNPERAQNQNESFPCS